MIFSFISSEILIENCGKSCIIGNRASRETHRRKTQKQHTYRSIHTEAYRRGRAL